MSPNSLFQSLQLFHKLSISLILFLHHFSCFLTDLQSSKMTFPIVGDNVRNYEIISVLGGGAFGTVYSCVDVDDRLNQLAIKAMDLSTVTRENSYKLELMVLQRVETLSEVEQTRFSKLIGNFIQDSSLGFFVMHKEGECVDEVWMRNKSGRFSASNVLKIVHCMAHGLRSLHKIGFIHRDCHAGNILFASRLTPTAPVKIVDFGIGRRFANRRGHPIPSPSRDIDFLGCEHCSVNVHVGGIPGPKDDFLSMVLLAIRMSGIHAISYENSETNLCQKKSFESNPAQFLMRCPWLVPVSVAIIKNDPNRFNYDCVIHAIENASLFNPSEVIGHCYENGLLRVF
ncbi:Protein kinase domain-containing protein [Caenorhabditis elegans]|uniref:Protein kinase domain-containing protein n=1 Tax=Caenorhabditis elegans TaxID=6239 RepID=Q18615_CAEEL|nr:Protein kinase domain-containing protein [Caenorhabditis elegans]CAA93637.1 Protein kinase domain-containing protein [Caenorhabditis elegans]|eukprot:NP_509953.1 Uncharacterized protein CELE_C44C10.7 [Caenorhabditis elegans]